MNSNRYTPKKIVEEQVCFSIPLYQRLFAWDDVQISGLLKDLKNHFESNADAPYYLGMLSCVASNNRYDLIDGQQRFTVMIFFALVMREYYSQWNCFLDGGKRLFFVSRTRDNEYLKDKIDHQESVDQNEKMKDGIECVERFMKDEFVSNNERQNFSQKVYSSLSFFFSELPGSYARNPSSLNKYFEAMNSKGKNLEQYEILKVDLMRGEINQDVLTRIWNSICDFDRPLINNPEGDICSFYEDAIGYCRKDEFEKVFDLCVKTNDDKDDTKISDVKPEQKKFNESSLKRNERSIISFPQFLMMVLDLYLDLSGEYSFYRQELLKVFDQKVNPIKDKIGFYNQMIFYRLLLDYYVIYKEGDESKDEYNILFKKGSSAEKIKQYQSMLYVSQMPFYIWLKPILKKLHDKSVTDTEELLSLTKKVDNDIHPVYKLPNIEEMSYDKGIDRYWFWRLDYYLWERKEKIDIFDDEESKQIVDEYVFRMNRSIEHLHPQHQVNNEDWDDKDVHSFGNLAMISQSFNSQQSDDPVTVKFARIKDQAHNHALQSLKLYHMYLLAGKNPVGWTVEVKNNHQQEMYELLKDSYQ